MSVFSEVTNVLFGFFVLLFLRYFWRRRYLYYYGTKVKGPLSFPIIGSSYVFLGGNKNTLEACLNLTNYYGNLYKVWFGSHLHFFVARNEDVQVVLNTALDKLPNMKFLLPVFGNGLIVLPAPEWKNHRKIMRAAFNQKNVNRFISRFDKYSQMLVKKLEESFNNQYIDLFPILSKCTLDFVSDTIMGVKLNAMESSKHSLIQWTSRLSEVSFLRILHPLLYPDWTWKLTSFHKETQQLSQNVSNFLSQTIKSQRVNSLNHQSYFRRDTLLDHFFNLEEKDETWNEELSVAECQTVIVAGSDATAITMGFVLMMLGMHQEIQTKLYEEISSVFDNFDKSITIETVQKLSYLERVIKETLRLFPLGPVIGRHLTEDVVLESHVLPKNSSVVIPIICIHRDPKVWPDPLKFDPDRFLIEEVQKRHPYSYLSFSGGPRNCLGLKYAMTAMKCVLSKVLKHYKIVATEYKSVGEIELKMDVATKCVNGQKVWIEKRM